MIDKDLTVEQFAARVADQLLTADLYYGHGAEDAQDEAFWLASYIAGFDYHDFETGWEKVLTQEQISEGQNLIAKRLDSKRPLAYLINQIWFAGQRFYIDEHALIPRSHLGEWVPERFEPWIDSTAVNRVLDLCCGGGSIGISCALHFEAIEVDLADLSKPALAVAQQNIDDYDLNKTVKTVHSDLFANISRQYDLIVCNPPYVSFENMKKLPREYTYEPEMALVSGEKGLDCIAIILNEVEQYLSAHGALVLEAGTAAPALERALENMPLNWMMSASGESVVLIITKQEILDHKTIITRLIA